MRRLGLLLVVGGLCVAQSVSRAQQFAIDSSSCAARLEGTREGEAAPATATRLPDSARSPVAVTLLAAASAGAITINKSPVVRVRLCGGFDSLHVVERRNLPNPVVVGRTYRDVYVAVEIFGRLNADCIVSALTSTPRDSVGQRNACASLEIGGTRTRPPEP